MWTKRFTLVFKSILKLRNDGFVENLKLIEIFQLKMSASSFYVAIELLFDGLDGLDIVFDINRI
jgi:hypothetical protein